MVVNQTRKQLYLTKCKEDNQKAGKMHLEVRSTCIARPPPLATCHAGVSHGTLQHQPAFRPSEAVS